MKISTFILVFIYNGYTSVAINLVLNKTRNNSRLGECGADFLPNYTVPEGVADIETYPWLGLLIYPNSRQIPSTTSLILITKQIALSTALDIDVYSKEDFRERSRVVMGHKCSGPYLRVKEYVYHPDFTRTTYSALAIVQLDTKKFYTKLFPICAPPLEFDSTDEIYAMRLTEGCTNSPMVKVYKMEYVDIMRCREFYRKTELDMESMWPTHLACARGLHGGHCVWPSGTALVIRDSGRWKLLGIGTYGPGCESPARFLDYAMYKLWVKRSIDKIGQPAITRLGPDHLILRRTTTNVQRFGPCDLEETKMEIFTDRTSITRPYPVDLYQVGYVKYNITLLENVEYHCIIFRVWNKRGATGTPKISLRRWCTNPKPICAEFTKITIFFFVEIKFTDNCVYKVSAYGTEIRYIDAKKILLYSNRKKDFPVPERTKFSHRGPGGI